MILADFHRYRGFSHSTDLLDHLFTVGFVTIGIDRMSIDDVLAAIKARGQVLELSRLVRSLRAKLGRRKV